MSKVIITIGRQFGSGGRETGKKLAAALGIEYYDKELLQVAAKESGLDVDFLSGYDEKKTNSLLYSIVMGQSNMFLNGASTTTVEQLASQAQREAVLSVAKKGNCVIVGRCADYILRDHEELVSVFISANEEDRIERICKRDEVDEKEAKEKMARMERSRRSHYNYNTDRSWGEASNYDLCINVSKCGIDAAVELIKKFVESKH